MELATDPNERRLAVIFVNAKRIMQMMFSISVHPDFVRVPVLTLPPDTTHVRTFFDPVRDAFGFVVRSASFEELEDGIEPPTISADVVEIRLERRQDIDSTPVGATGSLG